MKILEHAPTFWDDRVRGAALLEGFSEAHRELGYQVYYLYTNEGCATFHVRTVSRFGALFSRANVFCDSQSTAFMEDLIDAAKSMGIPLLRFGNSIYGLPHAFQLDAHCMLPQTKHTFITDLTADMDQIIQVLPPPKRRHIAKAKRSDVFVYIADSPEDIKTYCALSDETTNRVRQHKYYRSYPLRFFTTLFEMMVPKSQAFYLLSKHNGVPLAGGLFTVKDAVAVYFHGVSARRERQGPLQGPSLLLLYALEQAKRMGCGVFDWGGCSPDVSQNDSRYGIYQYKKAWGGKLVPFYNCDVWVNRPVAWMQERILMPAYDRLRRYVPSFVEPVY